MTGTGMSFRERLLHPDFDVMDSVLRPLRHFGEGHQQCGERITAVLDLLNEQPNKYVHCYRAALSDLPADEFALVIDALTRPGTGRLAESLHVTVRNGYGLRARTAVLVSMLAGGFARHAAEHLFSNRPEAREARLDTTLLHRRAQDLDAAEPLGSTFVDECSWYAVPTGDQAAVLDAFQLADAVPVGFREGARLFDPHQGVEAPTRAVLVTAALDGWTLVVHNRLSPLLGADLEALSARFGAAHSYGRGGQSGCGDWSDWTVAEHGTVLQTCFLDLYGRSSMGPADPDDMTAWVNDRRRPGTPALPAVDDHAFDDWNGWELNAESVAHRLSVSLYALGSQTMVKGTSVLATPTGS